MRAHTHTHTHTHTYALLHFCCVVFVSFTCAQVRDENSNLCICSVTIVFDIYVGVCQASNVIASSMLNFHVLLYPILLLQVVMCGISLFPIDHLCAWILLDYS